MTKHLTTASGLVLSTVLVCVTPGHAQLDDRMWGLAMIGVEKASEEGITGAGVGVGVVDGGIQFDHPEFADRWAGGFNVDGTPYGPADGHGTHVAGTIAGERVGVAPGVAVYGINWSSYPYDIGFANGYSWGQEQGLRIFNNSWETQLIDPIAGKRTQTIADVTRATIERDRPATLQALRETVEAGAVQIFATGNSGLHQPSMRAGLPYFFPEVQSHWLAVTAVGPSGQIASFANQCGAAAMWCLAAPGGEIVPGIDGAIWSSWPGSLYNFDAGTSMAASQEPLQSQPKCFRRCPLSK